jgi:hypothetical protein
MAHALPAPGALVPLTAAQAAAVAAVAKAFGAAGGEPTPPHAAWRPFDPSRAALLLFPSDERAAVGGPLGAAGLTLLHEELRLDAALPAAGGARQAPRGLLDAWGPDPARSILAQDEGATRAAAARELDEEARGVLERALAEPCALGAGELLETTARDGPVARRLARAHGYRAEPARLPDLLTVLRADARSVGVTPLARALLGGALWAAVRDGLPADEQVEGALADLALADLAIADRASADGEVGPLPGPFDAPVALDLPPAADALVDGLRRLARGEPAELPKPLPPLTLPARLADLGALARGGPDGLLAAARLGQSLDAAALDEGALVAVALGDHHAGRPGPERRARLRRLAAGLPPDQVAARLAAAVALVPDLAPVDALVRAALAAPPGEREAALAQVHARLAELAGEERAVSGPEVARARQALTGGPSDDLLDLALAAAEGATDLAARATRAVSAWATGQGPIHAVGPALDVLARAGVDPFDPAKAAPRELELLCHLAAARRKSGREPAPALLARLAARGPTGWTLLPDAATVEPAAVARLLGAALPRELALSLAAPLSGAPRKVSLSAPGGAPAETARPLLVAPRDEARWDAVEGGRAVTVVVVEPAHSAPQLERQAELLRATAAAKPPVGLELPTRAVSAEALGLGPGRAGLVAARVGGGPLPPSLAALAEVAAALVKVHAADLALGQDPLLAARRLPTGELGFAAGDAAALVDPARRAALQAEDVRRLAARAESVERSGAVARQGATATERAKAPTDLAALAKSLAARAAEPARAQLERDAWLDLRADASACLEDALLGRGPVTAADARHQLGPALEELVTDDEARDLLLGLGEAGAASGRFTLLVEPDGRFALTPARGGA